jgi:hypothetical protein
LLGFIFESLQTAAAGKEFGFEVFEAFLEISRRQRSQVFAGKLWGGFGEFRFHSFQGLRCLFECCLVARGFFLRGLQDGRFGKCFLPNRASLFADIGRPGLGVGKRSDFLFNFLRGHEICPSAGQNGEKEERKSQRALSEEQSGTEHGIRKAVQDERKVDYAAGQAGRVFCASIGNANSLKTEFANPQQAKRAGQSGRGWVPRVCALMVSMGKYRYVRFLPV